MRTLAIVLLASTVLTGCMGAKIKRLSAVEQDHYYALKVFMNDSVEKTFLKFKTEEERNAYLQERGLWDHFYKYPDHVRELIIAGEVQSGWAEDQMFMAWGEPYDRRRLTGRPASRSELFVYRFEVAPDGVIRVWTPSSKTAYKAVDFYQIDVYVDDERLSEMERKEDWD
ncbi:MAG: hypothetical protein KC912_19235 [Proteobacteria bacterium]|nr:hypothetical protein [Pseudomonadota bacterium]